MADVFDKVTKRLLKSVNTPDYVDTERYIINPSFVPECESKYIVVDDNNVIREMTHDERCMVDDVPTLLPTSEELAIMKVNKRNANVISEISKTYTITDEIGIIRKVLIDKFPDDNELQLWNDVVNDAKRKFPK